MKKRKRHEARRGSLDLSGFPPPTAGLPPERLDVARECRDQAALLVLGIGRGYMPEELVGTAPPNVLDAFGDALERDEALVHVTLLLDALLPRSSVAASAER